MKKITLLLFILFSLTGNAFTAGSSGGDTKSAYDQAVKLIKIAKKNEKKGKKNKAEVNYKKALKLLIKSNNEKPNKADTLNYLGFTSRKLGDYETAEKYYLEGLALKPNHNGINEYLGELYVVTKRHNLAIERLEALKGCDCEEYEDLKAIIAGEKVSKY
tara:strand:+ start:775 stop:1254 length:480 start_codon:yes stop_codon:yes gene_type:complete